MAAKFVQGISDGQGRNAVLKSRIFSLADSPGNSLYASEKAESERLPHRAGITAVRLI
jgi:hypothetical protein